MTNASTGWGRIGTQRKDNSLAHQAMAELS